ncbi:MAG: hypothetical protein RL338_438 [Chloroflexota bacterium]
MKETADPATRVTAPPARRTPIRRERLHGLIARATERRVTLVVAGPGHGKTHLAHALADDSPIPVRLVHLAERHRDPDALAGALDLPSAEHALVIVDRLEAIDGSPAVAWLADRLLEAPVGQRFVLLGRRRPALPLARLRAAGEVAEIDPADLRFDDEEIAALLAAERARPARHFPVGVAGRSGDEAIRDLVAGIRSLTGGWPLAVGMAVAAARGDTDRPEAVLDAIAPDLAVYLVDELVAPLGADVRAAIVGAGLLERLGAGALAAVAGVADSVAEAAVVELRAAGIVVADGPGGNGERCLPAATLAFALLDPEDAAATRRRHAAAAAALEEFDPVAASRHLERAGEPERIPALVRRRLATILDRGEAGDALRLLPPAVRDSLAGCLLDAHAALRAGAYGLAVERARAALDRVEAGDGLEPVGVPEVDGPPSGSAEATTVGAILVVGAVAADPDLFAAARALAARWQVALPAPFDGEGPREGTATASRSSRSLDRPPAGSWPGGSPHDGPAAGGVSYGRAREAARDLGVRLASGELDGLPDLAARTAAVLDRVGSPREAALARVAGAAALASLGKGEPVAAALQRALAGSAGDPIVLLAIADFHEWHGDPDAALALRDEATRCRPRRHEEGRDTPAASAPSISPSLDPFAMPRAAALAALRAACAGEKEARAAALRAAALAVTTGAPLWEAVARIVERLAGPGDRPAAPFGPAGAPGDLSAPLLAAYVAPLLAVQLDDLDRATREVVDRSIAGYPDRWRPILRSLLRTASPERRAGAARGLVAVGTAEDLDLILDAGRGARRAAARRTHAKALARRLAPPLRLDDLGRVRLAIGPVLRPGTTVRRRVLALVCYLATRTDLSATRDEVLDALWPELDPELAANSLNQTVYFLRRTLEDPYADDRSPDYVHHDSDVVWLDPALVTSRSRTCVGLVRRARHGRDERLVDELSETYSGRFALDFAYEPWAEHHRESLHAGYLATIEGAIATATERGEIHRAVSLARRALEVDPSAEGIELALLRLYRASGAHAAAAEQYAHYAGVLRDELGVEPPPLESL